MMGVIAERREACAGCTACYAACPMQCITMERDEEGFLYPVASDACIHCGRCEKVCPVSHRPEPRLIEQKGYVACSKSGEVWRASASGGAFSEICNVWADERTLIAGAAWDGMSVRHICVMGPENIAPLRKSKYIASDLGDTFCRIKDHLHSGEKAVFCGTPCQAAGLRAFLGREYENLLLIDLICHGAGSPTVFDACVDAMERHSGKAIAAYEFRAKREFYETGYLSKIIYRDGSAPDYLVRDPYIQLFLSQNCLRPSCGENCVFRTRQRQGDLTIADYKGSLDPFPHAIGSNRNFSSVVVNTEKGAGIISGLRQRMELDECSMENICASNPLFYRQAPGSAEREAFFADFVRDCAGAVEKWTVPATLYKGNSRRRLYSKLPRGIRKILRRLRKG